MDNEIPPFVLRVREPNAYSQVKRIGELRNGDFFQLVKSESKLPIRTFGMVIDVPHHRDDDRRHVFIFSTGRLERWSEIIEVLPCSWRYECHKADSKTSGWFSEFGEPEAVHAAPH